MNIKNKKIILVANTAWSMFNFRHGVLRQLLNDDHQLTVIVPPDDFSDKLRSMGCTVIDLDMSAKGTNLIEDIKLINTLYRHYRNIEPDFIIHYTIKPNIYGSISARLAGIPSLAVTTGLGYTFVNDNLVAKVARQLYKISFRYPREVWFLNEDDRQVFLKYRLVASNKAVLLHGEGVNLIHFAPQARSLSDGHIRFLLIARMLWDNMSECLLEYRIHDESTQRRRLGYAESAGYSLREFILKFSFYNFFAVIFHVIKSYSRAKK